MIRSNSIDTHAENDRTLDVYNRNFSLYLLRTPLSYNPHHDPLIRWIDAALSLIPASGKVLEIGSGHGRDANYIKSKGYNLLCSDGAEAFVTYLKKTGHSAITLNVLRDTIPEKFRLIFANAVVPHFTPRDLEVALLNIYDALEESGYFAFNVKQGRGKAWINEKFHEKRYVHFWQLSELRLLIEQTGFRVVFEEQNIQGGDTATHTWIHTIVQKQT